MEFPFVKEKLITIRKLHPVHQVVAPQVNQEMKIKAQSKLEEDKERQLKLKRRRKRMIQMSILISLKEGEEAKGGDLQGLKLSKS